MNYNDIKQLIDDNIKPNTNQDITAIVANLVMTGMIDYTRDSITDIVNQGFGAGAFTWLDVEHGAVIPYPQMSAGRARVVRIFKDGVEFTGGEATIGGVNGITIKHYAIVICLEATNESANDGSQESVGDRFAVINADGTGGGGDIEAIDVSYDDTATQLGVDNTQLAIEKVYEKAIVKDYINIIDFGAVGDGVTESAKFIQDALDFAETNGIRRVYAPTGNYLLEQTLYIPTEIEFYGDGMDKTIFIINDTTDISEITMFEGNTDVKNFYNPVISTKTSRTGNTLNNILLRDFKIGDIDFDDTGRRGYLVPMLILNTHNSTIKNVEFGNIETERDRNNERRVSMGLSLVFSENILIDRCIHGFAEYEGLSIRFVCKNITSRNNIFYINRPGSLQHMVHAVQVAIPDQKFIPLLEGDYGRYLCENYTSNGDVFNLISNVTGAITSHTSIGLNIQNSIVNYTPNNHTFSVFRPFDVSEEVIIKNNIINVMDTGVQTGNLYPNGIISIGTTFPYPENSKIVVSGNILNLELNKDVSALSERNIAALIGNLREEYSNASITDNVVNITGTGIRDQAVFGAYGSNIIMSGNVVNFDGTVSQNMRAFVVEGGDRINVINNSTIGNHAYSLKVNDVENLENLIIGANNFSSITLNNQETQTEVIAYKSDLTAENTSFDDTTTKIGETNVQSIIEAIVRRGVIKLGESLIFEVGYDKQFTSVSSAIEKALEYYPNETYTVTILIDEGFEIEENISYVNTDFSHIVLSTTGEVTVDAALTGRLFNFENCWLPIIRDFEITGNYVMTHFIYAFRCFAYSDSNLKVSGFLTSIATSSSSSCRSDNSEIIVPALNNTRGYNIQNSYFRIGNTKIISENTSALSFTLHEAVFGNTLSNVSISAGSEISGNFRRGVNAQGSMFIFGNIPIQSMEHDVFIEQGGVVNDILNLNRTSNVVKNAQTKDGLYLNINFPIPYSFDGTDYILYYIKAPSGQEYNVTVDEYGKLRSEAKPTIPTKTSDLINDGADDTSTYVEFDDLAPVATSNDYNDLDNKPNIPEQVNLIEGTNIEITGTYPNLVINSTASGGGTIYIELTKTQLDTAIANSELVPGALYKITEVETWMKQGETTKAIYLHAISTNELEKKGMGEFYVPKYNQGVAGYGIWSGELWQKTNGAMGTEPSYNINDFVIWGGKHWRNLTGDYGTFKDHYELDGTNWEEIPVNDTDYNIRINIIEYDYANDMITYRKDEVGNEVSTSYENWKYYENTWFGGNPLSDSNYNPTKIVQWGNEYDFDSSVGVGFNIVENGLFECINQRGSTYENTIIKGILSDNTLNDGYIINNNINFGNIYYNTLNSGNISNNIVENGSYIYNNTLNNGTIINNSLNKGHINDNIIENNGGIESNTITNGYIRLGTSNPISGKKILLLTINTGDIGGISGIDLSSATLVYEDFERIVFKNSSRVTKIRYFDEKGDLVVADLTD